MEKTKEFKILNFPRKIRSSSNNIIGLRLDRNDYINIEHKGFHSSKNSDISKKEIDIMSEYSKCFEHQNYEMQYSSTDYDRVKENFEKIDFKTNNNDRCYYSLNSVYNNQNYGKYEHDYYLQEKYEKNSNDDLYYKYTL